MAKSNENKMKNENDYSLVFMNLVKLLGNEDNSLHLVRYTCSEYSITEPSIQSSTIENPLIIYDIEVNQEITDEIVQKWISHSSKCTFLYIIIPQILKTKAETICVNENINNCLLIPFQFHKNGSNRNVEIIFP